MRKYTICENCKPIYDRDITDLSNDIKKLKKEVQFTKKRLSKLVNIVVGRK